MTRGAVDITIIKIDNEASWKEYKALTQKLKDGEFNIKQWKKISEIEMRRNQLLREKGKMLDMGVVFDQVAIDELGQDKTSLRYYRGETFSKRLPFLSKKRQYYVIAAYFTMC